MSEIRNFKRKLNNLTAVEARKIIEHLCLEESGEKLSNIFMNSTQSFLDLAREVQLIRPEPEVEEVAVEEIIEETPEVEEVVEEEEEL